MVCPKCGRVLLPGEICPCEQDAIKRRNMELQLEEMREQEALDEEQAEKEYRRKQRAEKANDIADKAKRVTSDVSNNVVQAVLYIFKNPRQGIREFVSEASLVNSLVLMVINSLLVAIMVTAAIPLPINKFSIWLITFLVSLVSTAGSCLGFFVSGKIQRNSVDFLHALCLAAPKCVFSIPCVLVAIVLMVVSTRLGLGLFVLSLIAGVCTDSVAHRIIGKDKPKELYGLFVTEGISVVLALIVLMLALRIAL